MSSERSAPAPTVGGQAVLEGVMMRGASSWAVAVRRPGGSVEVSTVPFVSVLARSRVLRLPVVRGAVALGESMGIGLRALRLSIGDEQELSRRTWAGTVALSLALSVALFFLMPAALTRLSGVAGAGGVAFVVAEKLVRVGVFLGYLWLVSRLRDLQRLFAYHGAEHKAIACLEAGLPLTPAAAAGCPRLHPRCGTSFLLLVMVIGVVVFAPLGSPSWPVLLASRVVGIPLVAGLAYEAIRWFGRCPSHPVARVLMWPGLQLQRLTTREPSPDQLEVALAALRAVLPPAGTPNVPESRHMRDAGTFAAAQAA